MIAKRTTATGTRYDVRFRAPDGKERSKSFRTRKEAGEFERSQRTDLARGVWIDPRQSRTAFAEVAAKWLESNPAKRSSTWARDETILRVHLNPRLGDARIAAITPGDVQRLVNEWSQ